MSDAITEITDSEVTGNQPNILKLMKRTKFHPEGRIQIDPITNLPRNPQNNYLRTREKVIQHEGIVIGKKEIKVYGGHVKAFHPITGKQDSVWRIGLGGPKKYHEKVLKDDQTYRLRGKYDRIAPQLEDAELLEYEAYKVFLKEKGKKIAENIDFYKWFDGKTASVEDGEFVITDGKKKLKAVDEFTVEAKDMPTPVEFKEEVKEEVEEVKEEVVEPVEEVKEEVKKKPGRPKKSE